MINRSSARPRDPAFARFASFGGFEPVEAHSAKTESGDPGQQSLGLQLHFWIPAYAGMSGRQVGP